MRLTAAWAPGQGTGDGFGIANVAFHEIDLAHRAQRPQEKGGGGMAGCHPDPPAGPGQRPDRMAAQETGAAEYRDKIAAHGAQVPVLEALRPGLCGRAESRRDIRLPEGSDDRIFCRKMGCLPYIDLGFAPP